MATKLVYIDNEHSRFHKGQIEWANKILNSEDVIFPNGRHSHDVALEVLESSSDALIDDLALQVVS